MSTETIIAQIAEVKERLVQIEEMAEDYKNAKSAITKKLLEQAIEKRAVAVSFKNAEDVQPA